MFNRRSSRVPLIPVERPGFTPSQITRLVLAVALLVVALPVGVKAAGSLVTIADSSTSAQARVDGSTGGLRVDGVTVKLLDRTDSVPTTGSKSYTLTTSLYSRVRIFVEVLGGIGGTVTVECVEGSARSCVLIPTANLDYNPIGYNNVIDDVPGRTIRVTVDDPWVSGLLWHVVVYGRAP